MRPRILSLILLLCRFFVTFATGHSSRLPGKEENFCGQFPGILLEESKIRRLPNGSLIHDGLLYPVGYYYRTSQNETKGCTCNLRSCLKKCCSPTQILTTSVPPKCKDTNAMELLPAKDVLAADLQGIHSLSEVFLVVTKKECPHRTLYLEPKNFEDDEFVLYRNGTLQTVKRSYHPSNYCLDWQESSFYENNLVALACITAEEAQDVIPTTNETVDKEETVKSIGIIISIPFLFVTFLVYAFIPELRNLYGKTLMSYVACLVMAYFFLALVQYFYFSPEKCTVMAFTIHFSFLSSFFWLNVMSFDIWWTFGGFRSLQGSVKQRERKKFIIYSIYAWGSATTLTVACAIMDFVPSVPKHFIKPQFGVENCWFATDAARAIYFYGPMGVTVLCNICLFILTALKILQHKKDTAHHLKGKDSKRHDDNKQWFNLYLKLFIVMGINWSMEIVSWLFKGTPQYVWYITDLTNTLQGVIIFLIFVWKDKIKRLLLKKFGCQGRDILSRNSTRSAYHSTGSRTCTTSAAPLQEKVNPYTTTTTISTAENSYRNRIAVDDSDCA